ncbi:hypothetical protein GQ44DRAFT_59947 [Phaeosphaeriaceae sp. PMI808]|nr:hypothetical protein GQ44DRAFT_59947 [Phaeosphaeriaceae sp. PMI808]
MRVTSELLSLSNLVLGPIYSALAPSFVLPNILKTLSFMTFRHHKFISTNGTAYVRSMFSIIPLLLIMAIFLSKVVSIHNSRCRLPEDYVLAGRTNIPK